MYTIPMIYFAHRGASALAVQNTLPAFEKARALGARCYELDVHLSADKQLVVHHDYTLENTAHTPHKIGQCTWKELAQIPLINPLESVTARLALLEEILPVVSPELELLNIEIKNDHNIYPQIEKILLDFLYAQAPALLPHILFSSFDYDTLLRLRKLDASVRLGVLTHSFLLEEALRVGAESVHINANRLTENILSVCHAHQLNVYTYTVNDIPHAEQLKRQGVDGIFTDNIHTFLAH